jgi:hypothetical protein
MSDHAPAVEFERPFPTLARNCPFYGRYLFTGAGAVPFLLIASSGNQCGLVTDAYAPCVLEIGHFAIEWAECPRVQAIRIPRPA